MEKIPVKKDLFWAVNKPVFFGANILIVLILLVTILSPDSAKMFASVQSWIVTNVKWYYVLTVGIVLVATLFLAMSRYGEIRLGPDHSRPEFANFSWFAMLFSTGMGIGLMFFGVAEPVMHYIAPPTGDPETIEAATEAMKLTFFHWGLHAWAIYAIVGLILAYFSFRHKLPLALRSALYPLIGDKIYGGYGHAIDIFAIIGTAFGVATSLGLGVEQIYSGLDYLFDYKITAFADNPNNQFISVLNIKIFIVVLATLAATVSVATGVTKGIKILSESNLILAVLLLLLVFFLGGRAVDLMQAYIQNIGSYVSDIVSKTFNLYAYEPDSSKEWIGGWTIFYWGWWISWSPFVGMFIAKISKGRTIRSFLLGVLLVPAGFTLFWMTIFGNSAIDMINNGNQVLVDAINTDNSLALFVFLESFPFSSVLSAVSIFMVVIFFVTSADSGALVMDALASKKKITPVWQRIYWGLLAGIIAITLMYSNGLTVLQTATIASALPFSVILLISIYGLFKALKDDFGKREIRLNASSYLQPSFTAGGWQKRLRNLTVYPRRSHVIKFIDEVVEPAFVEVLEEFTKQGITAAFKKQAEDDIRLEVEHGKNDNFVYRVKARHYLKPDFSSNDESDQDPDQQKYFRAEVYLDDGAKGYDIMGYSKENIGNDIIDQYTSHLYYIHNYQLQQDYDFEFDKTNES